MALYLDYRDDWYHFPIAQERTEGWRSFQEICHLAGHFGQLFQRAGNRAAYFDWGHIRLVQLPQHISLLIEIQCSFVIASQKILIAHES